MNKISVAIITKNEEANIRGCLESVRWADDVVVVDSGSTDQTLEICRQFPARIFAEEWKGFARQKNSAIAKTRHEWVLSLDADEVVGPELAREIQSLLMREPDFAGYQVPRMAHYLGRFLRHCWYPDYKLRLFRKEVGRWSEHEVHETVVKSRTA